MEPDQSGPVSRETVVGMLVRHHGRRAIRIAANRASKLAGDGDHAGALEWLRISEELVRQFKEKAEKAG